MCRRNAFCDALMCQFLWLVVFISSLAKYRQHKQDIPNAATLDVFFTYCIIVTRNADGFAVSS